MLYQRHKKQLGCFSSNLVSGGECLPQWGRSEKQRRTKHRSFLFLLLFWNEGSGEFVFVLLYLNTLRVFPTNWLCVCMFILLAECLRSSHRKHHWKANYVYQVQMYFKESAAYLWADSLASDASFSQLTVRISSPLEMAGYPLSDPHQLSVQVYPPMMLLFSRSLWFETF